MRHPLLLMLLVTLMGASPSFCQTRIIHGTVSDRKTHEPVPFATVLAKNSSRSATTDEDGRFSLIVPDSTITLAVNYLGYEPAEVKV